jgi:hypothetical protein
MNYRAVHTLRMKAPVFGSPPRVIAVVARQDDGHHDGRKHPQDGMGTPFTSFSDDACNDADCGTYKI